MSKKNLMASGPDIAVTVESNSSLIWYQEAHKLLQPADKTLRTMAIEFAEYQVPIDPMWGINQLCFGLHINHLLCSTLLVDAIYFTF